MLAQMRYVASSLTIERRYHPHLSHMLMLVSIVMHDPHLELAYLEEALEKMGYPTIHAGSMFFIGGCITGNWPW